jgi:hypothetical protein
MYQPLCIATKKKVEDDKELEGSLLSFALHVRSQKMTMSLSVLHHLLQQKKNAKNDNKLHGLLLISPTKK